MGIFHYLYGALFLIGMVYITYCVNLKRQNKPMPKYNVVVVVLFNVLNLLLLGYLFVSSSSA